MTPEVMGAIGRHVDDALAQMDPPPSCELDPYSLHIATIIFAGALSSHCHCDYIHFETPKILALFQKQQTAHLDHD